MTFDEMLKQALSETVDERIEKMLNVKPKPRFSLSYRLWERRTLKCLSRNHYDSRWTLHKARRVVTALAIIAAIALSLTACAVVNLAIGRFSFDDKTDYSKLFIENLSSDKTYFEEYYGLPEEDGWVIDEFCADNYDSIINYTCDDIKVTFVQRVIHEGNMGHINTEKADIEMLSLHEENDGFVLEFRDDWSLIYWIYDGYLLEISGNIDKNKAINLAKSTKIVDFPKIS